MQSHGDFVISWQNFNPNFTIRSQPLQRGNGNIYIAMGDFIPGGSINFSDIERNNETLKEVMSYVRIILTISIIGILLRQYYLVFLAILGVNIAIYGQEQENKKTLEKTANKEKNTK